MQKYAVQNYDTGEMFVRLYGMTGVEWSNKREYTARMSEGQANKLRDRLIKEKQDCKPVVVKVY